MTISKKDLERAKRFIQHYAMDKDELLKQYGCITGHIDKDSELVTNKEAEQLYQEILNRVNERRK